MRSHSGFKGKGFKFDETEAQLADERKKLQKAALGLQVSTVIVIRGSSKTAVSTVIVIRGSSQTAD